MWQNLNQIFCKFEIAKVQSNNALQFYQNLGFSTLIGTINFFEIVERYEYLSENNIVLFGVYNTDTNQTIDIRTTNTIFFNSKRKTIAIINYYGVIRFSFFHTSILEKLESKLLTVDIFENCCNMSVGDFIDWFPYQNLQEYLKSNLQRNPHG